MSARPRTAGSPIRTPFDAAELRQALATADAAVEYSPLGRHPWIYLDLVTTQSLSASEREGIASWLGDRACPVIGLAGSQHPDDIAAACDVVVTDDDSAQSLIEIISRTPLAAMTSVQVLRAVERLPVEQGLIVESLGYATLQAGPEFRAWLASRPRSLATAARDIGDREPPLRLARSGATLEITLARPAHRNALSMAMRDSLVEAFALVAGDTTIASAVVRGEGPDFCAGGDLAEFGTAPDPATAHAVRAARSSAAALAACRDRVRFHVHGACVGAGIELAAFGRELTASADAWFQLPELAFGLIPGAGGCVSIARRIGRQRTAWLALSGRRIDAATALAWGLIDSIGDKQ